MIRALTAFAAIAASACVAGAQDAEAPGQVPFACPAGSAVQGGLLICQTAPGGGVTVSAGDSATTHWANEDGYVMVAFRREALGEVTLRAEPVGDLAASDPLTYEIPARDYPISRLENVTRASPSYTEEELAHIRRSTALKREAFDTVISGDHWLGGFIVPVEGRRSGVYGSARILNGDESRPRVHWGIDIAAPEGTAPADFVGAPIVAPAAGTVTLADPDLFFEGGTIFLDHGDGLVSVFMHLSAVDVEAGQFVEQGEQIGAVGNTGRSTGPHLHWGLKYRDLFYIDPAVALALEPLAVASAEDDEGASDAVSEGGAENG